MADCNHKMARHQCNPCDPCKPHRRCGDNGADGVDGSSHDSILVSGLSIPVSFGNQSSLFVIPTNGNRSWASGFVFIV